MNFTIDRQLLQKHLRRITAISSGRSEETKYLSISVKKTILTLSATDQDIISFVNIKTDDKDESSCLVEAKPFYNLTVNLVKTIEEVSIVLRKDALVVLVGNDLYKFKTFNITFPKFDIHSYIWSFTVGGEKLFHLLKNSGWAFAAEDERTYLEGILFELDNKLFVSTSDARKFSCSSTDIEMDSKFKFVILSKLSKIINLELAKYKPKKKTDVANFPEIKFKVGKKYVDIIIDSTHYTSKIVDTYYPDIRNKEFKMNYDLTVNKKPLLDSILRLDPFTDTVKNMLSFVCDKKTVQLKSYNISDKLNSSEVIDAAWKYKTFEIGFRASSLADIMRHIVGKEAIIEFESEKRFFKVFDPASIVDTFYIIPYSKF